MTHANQISLVRAALDPRIVLHFSLYERHHAHRFGVQLKRKGKQVFSGIVIMASAFGGLRNRCDMHLRDRVWQCKLLL